MKSDGPRFETRRTADFERQLLARAKAWIPSWSVDEDAGDFGRALLHVAARFASEVGERLDRAGEKLRGGFFDWLGLRGEAARPARMPVVFRMVAKAPAGVLARAPVSMQVDVGSDTVTFETERDVRIVPGRIAQVVAVDADADAIYLPPPGIWDIEPVPAAPDEWRLKSFAAGGSDKLQLDPPDGLVPGLVIALAGRQYLIVAVDKDIVTIDPPLPAGDGVLGASVATRVGAFAPYDTGAQNRQNHALYLGDRGLLDIESAATIEVIGAQPLGSAVTWQYWGKKKDEDGVGWKDLTPFDPQPADAVKLLKPEGSIELHAVGNVESARWLRAYTRKVDASAPLLRADALSLRVNCDAPGSYPACAAGGASATSALSTEALANTTPLVLSSLFYPLGRTPKQFDAFYLACDEAFSKRGALVSLCFELASSSFLGLSPVNEGLFGGRVLAGVGDGGALQMYLFDASSGSLTKFRDRDPVQPPAPGFKGAAIASPPLPLDKKAWRLPAWGVAAAIPFGGPGSFVVDFRIALSAGPSVWVWHESGFNPRDSGWESFGEVPVGAAADPIDALVYLADPAIGGTPRLVALRGGKLAMRGVQPADAWQPLATPGHQWKCIAPILVDAAIPGALATSRAAGLVGIDSDKKVYSINRSGAPPVDLLMNGPASPDVQPFAYGAAGPVKAVVAVNETLDGLIGLAGKSVALEPGARVTGGWLEGALGGTLPAAVAAVAGVSASYLATWSPGGTGALASLFKVPLDPSLGTMAGAPALLSGSVVVPGDDADAFVTRLDLSQRAGRKGLLGTGIVVPAATQPLAVGDKVMQLKGGVPALRAVQTNPISLGPDAFQRIDASIEAGPQGGAIVGYAFTNPAGKFAGKVGANPKQLELQINEKGSAKNDWILVETSAGTQAYQIADLDTTADPWVAKLASDLTGTTTPGTTVHYWLPIAIGAREAPTLTLDPVNANWDAALLATMPLLFAAPADPSSQTGKALTFYPGNHPWIIVLDSAWSTAPAAIGAQVDFVLDAAVAAGWSRQLGNPVSNPELSWEYWNGAWSKLAIDHDATLNLKESGAVGFPVPDDIAATDWAGKTHFWIRARLVGGDYGSDKVTVVTTVNGNTSQQTVQHSTEGYKPPAAISLAVLYSVCTAVTPAYVVAEDSGTFRDQSDANRTPRAIVEAFVPLSLALGRLSSAAPAQASTASACPPECEGPCTQVAVDAEGRSDEELNPLPPATPASGRSIFVGIDGDVSGDSVNLLCQIATEHDHDAFAPMRVSTLVGAQLVPLVASDGTRALGESGIVTMAFEDAPTEAELFGQSLRWIRLEPRAGTGTWAPGIAGMYLNAAWASAQETLTRELLGSSECAPNLVVRLQRPPVLRDSLELRVREPLGDEEREALVRADAGSVVFDDLQLPGDWVLWKQVDDPADEEAGARVYALDEIEGTITFGDGLHGRIPPVGRDCIVAFEYKRTDELAPGATDVPGNQVAARTKVNLVTPLASVETAFSAADAAGGAPPEPPERVLRFGAAHLRNRGRVVAAADFADLAMETFRDIVQARAFAAGTRVRLVVVMHGADPLPSRAQRRELARFLLAAAPPTLDPAALSILGPVLRRLAIDLLLAVDSLDVAGQVSDDAKAKLISLFDTESGGRAGAGWQLGANPTADEIAHALSGIAHLGSIARITLHEVLADGSRGDWPAELAPHELVWLSRDAMRFEYVAMEAAA